MIPKIIITIEGGIVQSVLSTEPIRFMIIDLDEAAFDDEELFEIFPGEEHVYAGTAEADVESEKVETMFVTYERLNR